MISVLYLVSSLPRVGPTNQLKYIISNLNRQRIKPILVTLFREDRSSLINEFLKIDIDIHQINAIKNFSALFILPRLIDIVHQTNPDLIHSQGFVADALALLAIRRTHLTTLRNFPQEDYPDLFGSKSAQPLATLHLSLLKRTNVVSCSSTIQNKIKEFNNIKSTTIQNGVDTNRFSRTDTMERSLLRSNLGLEANSLYILIVGSLIDRKNVDFILKNIQSLKLDLTVLVAGDGKNRKNLEARYANGKFVFMGSVTNIEDYYKACDKYISASFSEGLPNSVLECMATGLEPLLSNIPQHREIFMFEETEPPIFFDPYDNASFKDVFIRSVNNQGGYTDYSNIVSRSFSAPTMSCRYQKAYAKLMHDSSRLI